MAEPNLVRCPEGHVAAVRNVRALSEAEYADWTDAYEAFLNGVKRPCCEQTDTDSIDGAA